MMRKIQITVILLVLAPSILIAGVMYYYTKSAIVEEKYESLAGITQMMDFYISQRYNTLISDISKKTEMDILKRRLETQEADSDKGSYNETREKISGASITAVKSTIGPSAPPTTDMAAASA